MDIDDNDFRVEDLGTTDKVSFCFLQGLDRAFREGSELEVSTRDPVSRGHKLGLQVFTLLKAADLEVDSGRVYPLLFAAVL